MAFTRPPDVPRICKIPECAHTIVYTATPVSGRPRTRHRPGDCSSLGCICSIPLAADGQVIPADRPHPSVGARLVSHIPKPAQTPSGPKPFSSNPFGLDIKPTIAELVGRPPLARPPDPPTWPGVVPSEPGAYVVEPDSMEGMLKAELAGMNYDHPMARTLSIQALKLARAADLADATDIKMVIASTKALQSVLNDIAGRDGGDEEGDDGPFGAVRAEIRDARPY